MVLQTLKDWFGPIPDVTDVAVMDRASPQPLDTRASLSGMVPGWSSGKPSWPTDTVHVMTRDGYRKCVTAFACINIIADAVAEATLRVWLDEGAGKRDEIVDHPLRQLLQHPNPTMSESELLSNVVRIAAIAGYCVVEKVRSARGNVVQLGILRPDYVRPILRDQRSPDWEYTVPGEPPAVLAAEDAVVFTYTDSPYLEVTGDTPLRAVLREAGILNELTDFVKLLLERGGMPQIALVVDSAKGDELPVEKLTDEERELIRQQFIAKYTGYRNWVGPAIIEGMRVEKIGFDMNEVAFTDLRDGIDLSVCRAFRVPPPVVQVMAGLETSYGQLLEQSMKLLQMYTANPLRSRLDGALSRQLLPEFDPRPNIDLGFDTSRVDALQEDEKAVHERARLDWDAGMLTLDEARQRIGEEALNNELGKSIKLSFSTVLTPVDRPLTPPPSQNPTEDEDDEQERMAHRTLLAPLTKQRDGRTYIDERSLSTAALRLRNQLKAHSTGQMLRLAALVEGPVAGFLAEQRERVMAALFDERGLAGAPAQRELVTADDPHQLRATRAVEELDWEAEDELLRRLLGPWWDAVGQAAFDDAGELLAEDLVWDAVNPHVREVVDLLGYRVTGINETTRRDIERILVDLMGQGTGIDEMADAVSNLFEHTYQNRHVTIARTESMTAYNHASVAAYAASGVVEAAQLFDNSQHTEDYGASDGLSCAERNGLVVPLDAVARHIAGEHPNGTLGVGPVVRPVGSA